ncbi:MAG TPA: hypothetical protein PK867_04600 [Pirellulales bacterium]|nr:hypothetical protein [Pirellulales bacterium]
MILPDDQRYLGRPASAADVALWVGELQAGVSDEQFEAALLAT